MSKSKKYILVLTGVLIASFIIAFLYGDKSNRNTISAAYVPAGFYAPIVIAEHKGYFEEAGYELELKRYNNNSLMINSFVNGSLDLTAQSSFTMFPINENNPNQFRFVYGQYANSYFFVVPVDKNYESLEQLKGKSIGAWQSPTAVAYIDLILANNGLKKSEYSVQRFAVSDVSANLSSEVVDAVFVFDFQAASLVESGRFKVLEPSAQSNLLRDTNTKLFNGGGMISEIVLNKDPDKSKAIKESLYKAINYIDNNPVESRAIIAAKLGVTINDLDTVMLDIFSMPSDEMKESAQKTYELLNKSGITKGSSDVSELFIVD